MALMTLKRKITSAKHSDAYKKAMKKVARIRASGEVTCTQRPLVPRGSYKEPNKPLELQRNLWTPERGIRNVVHQGFH